MAKRGRASGAELTVPRVEPIEVVQRPDAPYDLTDEQAEEWWAVVNRLPGGWFGRETHALLAQYCRHVVAARRVAELICACQSTEPFEVQEYDRLLKMQEREGRAMSSLATRMRITQQSTFDKERKKGTGGFKKPWQ